MDYYISPQGNDSTGDGSLAKPWKTPHHALQKTVAGDRAILRQGTYRGQAWPQRSGSAGAYISIEAFPGEKATLSALEELTGWEPFDLTNGKAIYRAPMPFSRCDQNKSSQIVGVDFLTWNSKVLREAQWPAPAPDEYPLSSEKWAAVDSGQWISDPNASEVTGKIEDADLLAFPSGSLVGTYITILLGARWTLVSGRVTANEGKTITFVVKSPGGDSYYNPDSRSLYFLFGKQLFLSYPGSWWRDAASQYVYVWLPDSSHPKNALVEALKYENVMDCYQKNYYRFKDISFVGSGINTYDASNFTFEGCDFRFFSHRLYVPNTWFWFNAAIYVNKDGYVFKDCDFKDAIGPAVRAEKQEGLIIENCTAINTLYLDFAGVNARFVQNTIWNCAGGCLKLSKNITGSEIKNNDLGYSGLMFTDGGVCLIATNCIGGGAQFFNNFLHDGYAPGDGAKEYYGTAGIYLESGVSNVVIRHNIFCRTTSPSVTMAAQNLENIHFYNNTFDGEKGIYWTPSSLGSQYANCKFINNYAQRRGDNTEFHPNVEYSRNTFKTTSAKLPANNLLAPDPKFNPDYSLQVGSPLAKAGVAIAGVTGPEPDIGAHDGGFPIVGALLRQKDLLQIKATVTVIGSTAKITISNLPKGRKPGNNFSVRIGTGTASSDLNNVPFNSTLGSEIFARVGTGEWVKIGTM
ncbi:MAG TPA: right-handed parallel beta-helix repeat-containing protein [Kamptonema sp.]|nr:right-handed parallel beta-helix repeat-containing protein [Kamptonema sp.]